MGKEYQKLDKKLFDKRRQVGTASVLLWGQPGGGKTHLAREYVNRNRKRFEGGIFWITSNSTEEMYHAFWELKQKVVARDAPHLCEGTTGGDFVQSVKSWFQSRHEWLIVFDGVTVEKDEDALDLNRFTPDSRNSSIIYISRAKDLRPFLPHPIKVGPLKEEEAQKLLFKTLNIKKPEPAEKKKASELVKKVGGLPLAIDAISHILIKWRMPLTKYKLSVSTSPGLESTYTQIFDDLYGLNNRPAWNMIHILCWFGQNIPVEMVHLGLLVLKVGRVEVRSSEDGRKPNINDTFSILMRYALIERNEPESDKDSMSSSRDSATEPELIDMLKTFAAIR